MKLKELFKNAWLKGWVLILPLALLASVFDALLLGGVRIFLAFLSNTWPSHWPTVSFPDELRLGVWVGAMSMVIVLRWLVLVVRSRATERLARTLEGLLKGWLMRVIRSLHPKYFHTPNIQGELRSAIRSTAVLPAGTEALVQAVQAFFQLLLFLPVLLWISWPLALALFLGLVPWVAWLQRRIQALGPDIDSYMQQSGHFEADLENWIQLQRSWVGGKDHSRYLHRLLNQIRSLKKVGIQAGTRKAFLSQSMEALSVFATVWVLGLCAWLIGRGTMTGVDLVLFCSALFICYKPLKEFTRLAPQLRDLQSAYQSLHELESMERCASHMTYTPSRDIQLGSVDFAYANSEAPVFNGLGRTLEVQRPILLKGPNGAGKTTLLRLLSGLELPDSGSIELPQAARNGVFFLSQRLFLPPIEWLAEVMAQGAWGPETQRFFQKVDAQRLLQKSGHSGGELQRLGLAWAVASGAPYLFLDEPLAFVAQGLRKDIFQAFCAATQETGQWWVMASHEPPPVECQELMGVWDLGS